MKKIIILLSLILLSININAQIIKAYGNYTAPPEPPADVYGIDQMWDGHTKAMFVFDTAVSVDAGYVTQWDDISGNGNHLLPIAADGSAGTADNRPAWNASTGVTFDGSNDAMRVMISGWTTFGSVYAVVRQITWASNDVLFGYAGTGSVRVAQKGTTPNLLLVHSSGDSPAETGLSTGTWAVIRLHVQPVANDNAAMIINELTTRTNTTDMAGFTSGGVLVGASHAAYPAVQRWGNVGVAVLIYRDIVDSAGDEADFLQWCQGKLAEL